MASGTVVNSGDFFNPLLSTIRPFNIVCVSKNKRMTNYRKIHKRKTGKNRHNPTILFLCGGMGPGGKERQIIELLKGLKQKNRFRTIMAVGSSNGAREAEAAKWADQVLRVRRFSSYDLFSPVIDLIHHVKKDKIDVIHTWGGGIWDLFGLLVARYSHIPVIHGGIRSAPPSLDTANKISRWAASHSDVIVANSQAGLDSFGFHHHPRARVVYNGVDFSRFVGIETSPESEAIISMVANFSDKKDHATLVFALPHIIRCFPEARLVLVGHDQGTLENTRKWVDELDLSHFVQFVTNTLNPESIIVRSKVCILSTFTEAISNSILEYMGMHKPVIATANSGNAEVVEQGVTGFLIPPRSPHALAEQVIQLLNNPDLARSMGEAGYQRLTEKFSLAQMVEAYEDLYFSLLEK